MTKRATSSSDFVDAFEGSSVLMSGKRNWGNHCLLSSGDGVGDGENKSRKKLSCNYKNSNNFFPSPHTPLEYCSVCLYTRDELNSYDTLYQQFNGEEPRYPYRLSTHRLSQGSRIDLKSLLSNKKQDRYFLVTKYNRRVEVARLKGKYVLICCFFIPVLRDSSPEVDICVAMGALYSELCMSHNFEMIMVAKMRSDWDSELVFDHFFSGFHDNCLAIPYSDSESRDFVAKSLGLCSQNVATLVLSPSGEVLQKGSIPSFLKTYGVASFPFTDGHFADLYKQDVILKRRVDAIYNECWVGSSSLNQHPWSPISLQELVQCDTLSRISDDGVCVSVSDLNKKLVGLYLCENGGFMEKLSEIQRQCIEQGLEFEIVLVCLAFHNDPQTYMSHVKLAAQDLDVSHWWVLPYNDKLCRTLWRICQSCGDDQMIILPPPDGTLKSGDFSGKAIVNVFGIKDYPFTKEAIIAKKESFLKSYSLESLLQEFEYVVQYRGRLKTRVPLSDLRDKNVLLYLDFLHSKKGLYKLVRECYSRIQSHHPGTQIIFVPIDGSYERSFPYEIPPWLMMLPSTVSSVSVINKVFMLGHSGENDCPTLIAYGKNGQMLSRNAAINLPRDVHSLFRNNLRSELITQLEESLAVED